MGIKKTLAGLVLSGALALGINSAKGETIGIWNFNEGSGYVAYDSSTFQNNGQISNGDYSTDTPYTNSPFSMNLNHYPEASGFVSIPHDDSLNLGSSFTFESWIKPFYLGRNAIITKSDLSLAGSANPPYTFDIRPNPENGNLSIYARMRGREILQGGGQGEIMQFSIYGETPISLNDWHYVAANYDGTNLRVFLDGQPDGQVQTAQINIFDYIDNPSSLLIGRHADIGGSYYSFHGMLDDVRISNDAHVPIPTPEPSTLGLLCLGSLALLKRRKDNRD